MHDCLFQRKVSTKGANKGFRTWLMLGVMEGTPPSVRHVSAFVR